MLTDVSVCVFYACRVYTDYTRTRYKHTHTVVLQKSAQFTHVSKLEARRLCGVGQVRGLVSMVFYIGTKRTHFSLDKKGKVFLSECVLCLCVGL